MHKVYLLGIDGDRLTPDHEQIVGRCGCLVASTRHKGLVDQPGREVLPITPVNDMLTVVAGQLERVDVAILTSGDPLFYGVGRKLLQRLGAEAVEIHPGLSSMQLAFARFKTPWDDAVFVSLHGRSGVNMSRLLLAHHKVFVLTDRDNSPAVIAGTLLSHLKTCGLEKLADDYEIFVGENLGLANEKLHRGSLAEIAAQKHGDLNVMIIKRPADKNCDEVPSPFGLTEEEISHSRGLITKNEVRAASIHALRLPTTGVFWDIGAGSGSISVEAAILCPHLDIYAVERNALEIENIKRNIRRFGLHNITLVEGEAPSVLTGLPTPDRVFVGGSGGRLGEIIGAAALKLTEKGRIIVNGVIEKTKRSAPALLYECGLKVAISEISITRKHYPEKDSGHETFNTIAVIVGKKY